jgi:hypothetical protein
VVLKMTDYRAEVTGAIVTERGVPAPEFMIVVYPANPKEWDSPSAFGRPQHDGTFNFRLRRPGTYRVGFIPDYDPAVRIGPDILGAVDRKAMTVAVAEGQKKAVRLVVPAERDTARREMQAVLSLSLTANSLGANLLSISLVLFEHPLHIARCGAHSRLTT